MDYLKQAKDFLNSSKTTLEVVKIGNLIPEWDKDGIPRKTLSVTLKNDKHTYNFKFYCSLNDTYGPFYGKYKNHKPNQYNTPEMKRYNKWCIEMRKKEYHYDILACLNVDYSDDFEDFCEMYGYDTDSISHRDIYLAVRNETKNLKRLFNEQQLNQLSEIA